MAEKKEALIKIAGKDVPLYVIAAVIIAVMAGFVIFAGIPGENQPIGSSLRDLILGELGGDDSLKVDSQQKATASVVLMGNEIEGMLGILSEVDKGLG